MSRSFTTYQPFAIYDIPRTDNNGPPSKPPVPKGSGDYCFRGQVELMRDDKEIMKFIGYDKDFSILEKVQEVCKIHEGNRNNAKCTQAKLFFMKEHPECEGQINIETNIP